MPDEGRRVLEVPPTASGSRLDRFLAGPVGSRAQAQHLIDRIAHGAVTDFIKLPAWPAFNVADMAITFGVLALLWVLEGPHRREG